MSEPAGESLRDRLTKATLLLSFIALLSRALGYLRDATIAYKFGLRGPVDAYFAAIHVPDILNYLVAGGALSSTFVPLFQEYWQRQRHSAAWTFFAVVGSLLLVLVVGLVVIFEIWTRPIIGLMFGHGRFTPEQLALVVRITRIVLPAQVFFVIGGLINGVLYSVRGDDKWYVALPTLGAVIYNLSIIVGGLALAPTHGIEGFAWGGLVGAFVGPFLLVAMAVIRVGGRFRFQLDMRHPGLRRFLVLTLPLMIAISYSFVDQIIVAVLGVRLPEGSISALNNAYRLMLVPVGVFGLSAATAAIGTLAGLAATGNMPGFRQQVREALGRVGVMVFPMTVLAMVLAPPVVRILYQHGAFDAGDTARVASVLRWYALGMYAWSINYVLARGMYSLQDTIMPAILGTLTTAVMFPLSWVLMGPLGAEGLALATTLGISMQSLAIFLALRRKVQGLHVRAIAISLRRMLLASGVMAVVCLGVQWGLRAIPAGAGVAGQHAGASLLALLAPASGSMAGAAVEVIVVAAVGMPVFAAVSLALGEEEATYLWAKILHLGARVGRRSRGAMGGS